MIIQMQTARVAVEARLLLNKSMKKKTKKKCFLAILYDISRQPAKFCITILILPFCFCILFHVISA